MDEKEKKSIDSYAAQQYTADYKTAVKILKSTKGTALGEFSETTQTSMPDVKELKTYGSGYWLYYFSLNEENIDQLKAHFDNGLLSCYGNGENSLRHTFNEKTVLHILFGGEKPNYERLRNDIYPWAVQHIWEILDRYFKTHKKEIPENEFDYFEIQLREARENNYLKELDGISLIKQMQKPTSATKAKPSPNHESERFLEEINTLKQRLKTLQTENANLSAENKRFHEQKERYEKESAIKDDELAHLRRRCKKIIEESANDKMKYDDLLIITKEQTAMQMINALKEPIYNWEQALSGDNAPAKFARLKSILMSLSEIGIETVVSLSDLVKMNPLAFDENVHYDSCSIHENGQAVYAITLGFRLSDDNIFGLGKRLIDKAEVRSILNDEGGKDILQ